MSLDKTISPSLRALIEQRYYALINHQARMETLFEDPSFSGLRPDHYALFSDHGVVHVRDVAQQVLACLEIAHGLLIPIRSVARYNWMQAYGVIVTYLHDIGMADCSKMGRAVHPQAAAQACFKSETEDIVEAIWQENSGDIAGRVMRMQKNHDMKLAPTVILRELLAMSQAHSKRLVLAEVLNEPHQLRQIVQNGSSIDLHYQYSQQFLESARAQWEEAIRAELGDDERAQKRAMLELAEFGWLAERTARPKDTIPLNPEVLRFYGDYQRQSFAWLDSSRPMALELTQDVIDTVRVLRCADALRQRGTVLKTSGSYEVFVDQQTANAVYALRKGEDQLVLFEIPSAISAGEANIASTELTSEGDLRLSFHRGSFTGPGSVEYAANCAAVILRGIKVDAIDSFQRPGDEVDKIGLKPASAMKLLLEDAEDNPDFVGLVQRVLRVQDQELADRTEAVPSLNSAAPLERERYLATAACEISADQHQELLETIGRSGHLVTNIDPDHAFKHVKQVCVQAGETLVEAGASSAFVYIPLGPGLKIIPLGGYAEFAVQPWMPLGITGVIRGADRNATVVAEGRVNLLMIPKAIYLRYWHRTHSEETFRDYAQAHHTTTRFTPDLTVAAKVYRLKTSAILSQIETSLLMTLAREMDTVAFPDGSLIFGTETVEENLYLLLSGQAEAHMVDGISITLVPGDLFGDLVPFPSGLHEATVVAISRVKVLRLSGSAFEEILNANGKAALSVVQALAQQFKE